MRIALLLGANPKLIGRERGPKVPISAGKWRVVLNNVKDSLLHIKYNSPQSGTSFSVFHGYEFKLSENTILQAMVTEPGSEDNIKMELESV